MFEYLNVMGAEGLEAWRSGGLEVLGGEGGMHCEAWHGMAWRIAGWTADPLTWVCLSCRYPLQLCCIERAVCFDNANNSMDVYFFL